MQEACQKSRKTQKKQRKQQEKRKKAKKNAEKRRKNAEEEQKRSRKNRDCQNGKKKKKKYAKMTKTAKTAKQKKKSRDEPNNTPQLCLLCSQKNSALGDVIKGKGTPQEDGYSIRKRRTLGKAHCRTTETIPYSLDLFSIALEEDKYFPASYRDRKPPAMLGYRSEKMSAFVR